MSGDSFSCHTEEVLLVVKGIWMRPGIPLNILEVQARSWQQIIIQRKILIQNAEVKKPWQGFCGGAVVKNPPANAGDTGSSPGPGRSHMPRSN